MHLEMLVVACGHEVCAIANCAASAIAYVIADRPDVLLMDIRLARGSSGIDAACEIHARHGLRSIFLSGNIDEATKDALQQCEPIEFVGKPVLQIVLQRALSKAERLCGHI